MLLTLVIAHMIAGLLAPVFSRLLGSRGFFVMALAPAAACCWLIGISGRALSGDPWRENISWIPRLNLDLTFAIGPLQWVLGLIVTGIGALVLVYCRWYFDGAGQVARVMGLLTAFAGSMLGLVTADNLILVYVCWELTTVISYLLIGHDPTRRANRSAALTALIVTTTGGLAMLVGMVLLGHLVGSFSLLDIAASTPRGAAASVAALLLLAGALSKSALVPFHFWLPGAMAAPTPVSAYLHAAAMVKAGVYLVAVLAPTLAGVPGWRPVIWILGACTLVLGGWRALRQDDLKLLLAYGTVSQLGLMVLLVGTGTRAAALGGLAMVVAHALFKSALFLVVGVIDHSTGTRLISRLAGLRHRMPVTATAAALAAASMAGIPPTLGFIAKEGGLEGLAHLATHHASILPGDGTGLTPLPAWVLFGVVVFGSALTVAYSLRFWWGAFADRRHAPAMDLTHPPTAGSVAVPGLLGLACLALGFLGHPLTSVFERYAESVPTGEHGHGLTLLVSPGLPLAGSAVAILGGVALFWQRNRIAAVQRTFPAVPAALDMYRSGLAGLDRLAVEVTSWLQRGSLASYVATILVTQAVLLYGALARVHHWPRVRFADSWGQVAVGSVIVVAAFLVAGSRGRLRAVILLGITGYGTALLFLLHGAPDLALTQILVETVSLVVFLLVLRKLPRYFTERALQSSRWWRVVLAAATGLSVTLVALLTLGSRTATPVSEAYPETAKEFGFGSNIVNVVLVDTRAWDTIGEISVLSIAATGVASLIFLRGRSPGGTAGRGSRAHQPGWLAATGAMRGQDRSLMFEVVTRLLFPVMLLVSVYLLLAGHNSPGGGFAGGLVAGMALLIRYLAAGSDELDHAMPVPAGRLLGAGLVIAVATALAPLFAGGVILQSYDAHLNLGLGHVHLVSSTFFDIGVYLVVIGMMLDLGRSLGGGIDEQARQHLTPAPEPNSARAVPGRRWHR